MSDLPPRPKRKVKLHLPLTADHAWSVAEAAYRLGVSEGKVRALEGSGDLPSLPRIGTRIRFDPRVVDAYNEGWRPPAGWKPRTPPPQVFPIDGAPRP